MFDEIICDYKLPGNPPKYIESGHRFQTKDFDCGLDIYRITEIGNLVIEKKFYGLESQENKAYEFTGEVNFYTTNICASGPGLYTPDGADADSVDYIANFKNGILIDIKETVRETVPALPSSEFHLFDDKPSKEELQKQKEYYEKRYNESLIGKELYVLWGGNDVCYKVKVLAENKKELVTQHEDGKFEILSRHDRDRCFWNSEADALENKRKKDEKWNKAKKRYDDLIEARKLNNSIEY